VRFAGACPADQHHVALLFEETAGSKVADQRFVDRSCVELELVDILGERQLGDRHLVLDRTRFLLVDLGIQKAADDAVRFMLALDGRGNDLVIGIAHAIELGFTHGFEDVAAFHHMALRRLS